MPMALLNACAQERFDYLTVDIVNYDKVTMDKAASEIEGGSCPVLSDVFMPDYSVMRDQARAAK